MIVLDTHAWVWWVASPDLLSARAQEAIEPARERQAIYVSAVSCWEIALLVRKGRLELTIPVEEWVARCEALPWLQFVPLDNRIALRSNRLPGELHEDPADRILIATALTLGYPLISKDNKIRDYPHVETIW